MSLVNNLRDIVCDKGYDGLLLDQYGVLHNGEKAFPLARAAVESAKNSGAKIVILSNSSRRSTEAFQKLERLGIDPNYFVDVVTSGELTHNFLCRVTRLNEGKRVLHLNWGKERGSISLRDYDLQIAENSFDFENYRFPVPSELSLVICHGIDAVSNPDGSISEVPFSILERFVKRLAKENPNVPFVCANPDFVTVSGSVLRTMPGTLAKIFQTAGGTDVRLLGKPYEVAYERAVDILKGAGSQKFLAVGDSLAHDILGAHSSSYNIDSLYIAGGIDAQHFRLRPGDAFVDEKPDWSFSSERLSTLIQESVPDMKTQLPTYVMPFMRW